MEEKATVSVARTRWRAISKFKLAIDHYEPSDIRNPELASEDFAIAFHKIASEFNNQTGARF